MWSLRRQVARCLPACLILVVTGGARGEDHHVSPECAVPRQARLPTASLATAVSPDNIVVICVDSPVDFAHIGKFDRLDDQIRRMGVRQTYFFNQYRHGNANNLAHWIRCVKWRNPSHRIMIVSWSFGAYTTLKALRKVESEGICIDSFVILDSFVYRDVTRGRHPTNVGHYVLVYRTINRLPSGIVNGSVYRVNSWRHLDVPSAPITTHAVSMELARLRGLRAAPR